MSFPPQVIVVSGPVEDEGASSAMTKKETSDSNSSNSSPRNATTSTPRTATKSRIPHKHGSSCFKGVVFQKNGHWGAQIYANHERIWLGTFKTEMLAAMAYDSANILLRSENSDESERNVPLTPHTQHEPAFQANYTKEEVLSMIKDGSYQTKFAEFLESTSQRDESQASPDSNLNRIEGLFRREIFRKELTPSDVGKLNRLVIPKRHASKFLPTGNEIDEKQEVDLLFYDESMTRWIFRYCYWKSSQSYVFTKGWNKFVKEMNLKANDALAFYKCDLTGDNGDVNRFCMVEIVRCNHGVQPDENIVVELENRIDIDDTDNGMLQNNASSSGGGEHPVSNNNNEVKSIRLFGVQIFIESETPSQCIEFS